MKKTFLIAAVTFLSISSYATETWSYNCPGGGKVIFTTSDDTTVKQATAMGRAWCDNR